MADRTLTDHPGAMGLLYRATARMAACAVAVAVLAACSSSPDPTAQAGQERSAVLPVAKELRSQLAGAGVSWTASIVGDYEACGVNDPLATSQGSGMLQYTARQLMTPFSPEVPFPTFARQVVAAVNAAGWHLRPVGQSSDASSYYAGQRDGLDLRLVEFNDAQGAGPGGAFHQTATIYVSGNCFDAGSSAHDLTSQGTVDNVHEPSPATTPIPKSS